MALLEICCYSLDCALVAQQSGADRIELCSAPAEGGLTPSAGLLQAVRRMVTLPVHPIVRPRGGDFCYDEHSFEIMLDDISRMRDTGFPGIVTGVLGEDGEVDLPRMSRVMAAAGSMAVTFHRAFDVCRSPREALCQLADLGVARVLTSGQAASAEKGIALLRELIGIAGTPIIMAGAGVRPSNIRLLVENGIQELHSSAGEYVPSVMRYQHQGVSMSADPDADEFRRYRVSASAVAEMKAILSGHTEN
ncbi:copper homeostasis protein CutC [Mangrovibacter plantisponsor]|uniref:PF03932 family protein CutC n=1 Tax=Mangrovibacter plantisponsor TaxID=451513 RepID=A0A317PWZ6_9ENTR|nr:copper homeostasis protein CutC [Mangrovibacter plantisponsor]PWW07694.1 copper homeostasis protein CutC [Mangrovibacter plantisponsor]